MILVTGAAGKTGQAILRALRRRGAPTRAFVRRPGSAAAVGAAGAVETVVGDLRDEAAVGAACDGVTAVYHLRPNVSPDELAIGRVAIGAARQAAVERFVFHSVLHPETEAMPHHWRKLRVEEALVESGLRFTVLRPTAYMQNLLASRRAIVEDGSLPVPYDALARISLVDLEDVAEVAARVLTETGHEAATYELVGTEPLTQEAVAATLSEVIGRRVRVSRMDEETWRAAHPALGGAHREALIAMFRFYDRHGLEGNPNVLRWLLGRSPTGLAAFAARVFRPDGASRASDRR